MEAKTIEQSAFNSLNAIDCNEHTEQKNGLTYLSWAWAWAEVKKRFPDATYKVYKDERNHPYIQDEEFGLMVFTSASLTGKWDDTLEMWLPVMDSSNHAMKRTAQDYTIATKYGEKKVHIDAVTMFDINKTIMRCLVKNFAMFGLGLYIYAGEDLPEEVIKQQEDKTKQELEALIARIGEIDNVEDLGRLWNSNPGLQNRPELKAAITNRRTQLQAS